MNIPKVEAYLPTDLQCLYWSQNIVYWAGRLWTLYSLSLFTLINEVITTIFIHFTSSNSFQSSSSPSESSPLGRKKFKKEESIEKETLITVNSSPNESPKPTVDTYQDSGKEGSEALENDKSEDLEKPQPSKFTRFKRIRKKKDDPNSLSKHELKEESKSVTAPITDTTPKPTQPPKPVNGINLKPIFYDNAGKGNCQLLSILKGLEMQYPDLLKDQRKGQTGHLTAQTLRQMGVDFARHQVETCGEYVEDILGYLDTDRKEFNCSQVDPVERNMQKDLAKIERNFKSHKNKLLYEKQKITHHEKYKKLIDHLENNIVIKTDEDFLNHLEKNGFYCSTLHLFALSILLELPIYVKEQKGVKGHDLQMFNPTNSIKEPVYLYRVADRHYQYIFYSNS